MSETNQQRLLIGPAQRSTERSVQRIVTDLETNGPMLSEEISSGGGGTTIVVSGGGASPSVLVTVDSYDPDTRLGTAVVNGQTITFANGTSKILLVGEFVVLSPAVGSTYLVAVAEFTGGALSTTPESRVCIAVIDENDNTTQTTYNADYTTFRTTWPQRELWVFRVPDPNNRPFRYPANWGASTLDKGPFTVTRDSGINPVTQATDWFTLAQLDRLPPGAKVGLFIDDSGSMRVSDVQRSLDIFNRKIAAAGLSIITVSNTVENYIAPFITMTD
jgi:hypothetical protein